MGGKNDLLGYLRSAYAAECADENDREPTIDEFIDWARKHLDKNQPVTTSMMGASVAVTLQDGTQVFLVDNEDGEPSDMQQTGSPAVPLTSGKLGHRGGMAKSTDHPITG